MLIKVLMVAEQGYLEEKPYDLGDTETQKNFWIYRKKKINSSVEMTKQFINKV